MSTFTKVWMWNHNKANLKLPAHVHEKREQALCVACCGKNWTNLWGLVKVSLNFDKNTQLYLIYFVNVSWMESNFWWKYYPILSTRIKTGFNSNQNTFSIFALANLAIHKLVWIGAGTAVLWNKIFCYEKKSSLDHNRDIGNVITPPSKLQSELLFSSSQ